MNSLSSKEDSEELEQVRLRDAHLSGLKHKPRSVAVAVDEATFNSFWRRPFFLDMTTRSSA